MSKFYAVQVGIKPGVFTTWDEAEAQVKGYPGAKFKSFRNHEDALAFAFPKQEVTPVPIAPVLPSKPYVEPTYIYVDGAYRDGVYAWAFVVVYNDEWVYEEAGVGTNEQAALMHNIAGELSAAMRAARWAYKNNKHVIIKHDLEGTAKWVTGEFKTSNEFTRKYADFMRPLQPTYTFEWVRGHSGNRWNDYVDALAYQELKN